MNRWVAGIDLGSTMTKLVVLDPERTLRRRILQPTAPRMEAQAERLLGELEAEFGELTVVATGYGRQRVARAARRITEITAHAAGFRHLTRSLATARTLIDIGGQDTKVIVLDAQGSVLRFGMNDKCAAGTGRFLESTAQRLGIPLADFGPIALGATREATISNTCTVFAESEIVSALAEGEDVPAIARGLHRSLVRRVVALARSTGIGGPVALSGGVALDEAVAALLAEELGAPLLPIADPQMLGALGAALSASHGI